MKLPTKEELLLEYIDAGDSEEDGIYRIVSKYVELSECEAADFMEGRGLANSAKEFRERWSLPATPATEQETATTAPRAAGMESMNDPAGPQVRCATQDPCASGRTTEALRSDSSNPVQTAGSQPSSSPPIHAGAGLAWGRDVFQPSTTAPLTEADVRRIADKQIGRHNLSVGASVEEMREIARDEVAATRGVHEKLIAGYASVARKFDKLEAAQAEAATYISPWTDSGAYAEIVRRLDKLEAHVLCLRGGWTDAAIKAAALKPESPAPARESEPMTAEDRYERALTETRQRSHGNWNRPMMDEQAFGEAVTDAEARGYQWGKAESALAAERAKKPKRRK